jgi:hypothetical protein
MAITMTTPHPVTYSQTAPGTHPLLHNFYLATSPTAPIQLDCLPSYSILKINLPGGSNANIVISRLAYLVPLYVEATYILDI